MHSFDFLPYVLICLRVVECLEPGGLWLNPDVIIFFLYLQGDNRCGLVSLALNGG